MIMGLAYSSTKELYAGKGRAMSGLSDSSTEDSSSRSSGNMVKWDIHRSSSFPSLLTPEASSPPSSSRGPITDPPLWVSIVHLTNTQFLYVFAFIAPFTVGLFLLYRYPRIVGTVTLIYYIHVFLWRPGTDGDGRRWLWFSRNDMISRIGRIYHELVIHVNEECLRDENKQIIFACHPHGVLSDFRTLVDGPIVEKFTNILSLRVLAADVLFYIPLVRELIIWTGCINASRSTCVAALKRGHSILVMPGGEAEQMATVHGREILYLKRRKGFVRLAMMLGLPVVPAYIFGVNDLYYTFDWFYSWRMWLMKKFRIAIPLFAGRWFTLGPLNRRLTAVFGRPIHFQKREVPTEEEVNQAHQLYMDRLVDLFDANKEQCGYGGRTLEII